MASEVRVDPVGVFLSYEQPFKFGRKVMNPIPSSDFVLRVLI